MSVQVKSVTSFFFFFQAEDGIRDATVTGVQTCALPISGVRVELDLLVAGPDGDENHQLLEPELGDGRARERDVAVVRRIEGPAEETDHASAATLTPTRAPRRRSRPGRPCGHRLPRARP